MRYGVPHCPFNILRLVTWLVIENTTVEDASKNYECYARYSISNPTATFIASENSLRVNPGKISPILRAIKEVPPTQLHLLFPPTSVYPLIEVVTLDTPAINSTYVREPVESLPPWSCSVLAGVGDKLIWTLDDNNVANITLNAEDLVSNKVS